MSTEHTDNAHLTIDQVREKQNSEQLQLQASVVGSSDEENQDDAGSSLLALLRADTSEPLSQPARTKTAAQSYAGQGFTQLRQISNILPQSTSKSSAEELREEHLPPAKNRSMIGRFKDKVSHAVHDSTHFITSMGRSSYRGQGMSQLRQQPPAVSESSPQKPTLGISKEAALKHTKIAGKVLHNYAGGNSGIAAAGSSAAVALLVEGATSYAKARVGTALEGGKMGTRSEALASAGAAVKHSAGKVAMDAGKALIPYYTATQDFKTGHFWAGMGWAALDTVGIVTSFVSFGGGEAVVASIKGGAVAAKTVGVVMDAEKVAAATSKVAAVTDKVAEATGKVSQVVNRGHQVYAVGQVSEDAKQTYDFLQTDKGALVMKMLKEEVVGKGIQPDTVSTFLRKEMTAQGLSPDAQGAVVSEFQKRNPSLMPLTVRSSVTPMQNVFANIPMKNDSPAPTISAQGRVDQQTQTTTKKTLGASSPSSSIAFSM